MPNSIITVPPNPQLRFRGAYTWAQTLALSGNRAGDTVQVSDLGYAQFVWNGTRWRPPSGVVLVGQYGGTTALTGTTTPTTLQTITVPGNLIGPQGRLRITVLGIHDGVAGTKTLAVNFGGTNYYANTSTTSVSRFHQIATVQNLGSLASQRGYTGGIGQASGSAVASSIDTSINQDAAAVGTLTNASDSVTLYGLSVEVIIP